MDETDRSGSGTGTSGHPLLRVNSIVRPGRPGAVDGTDRSGSGTGTSGHPLLRIDNNIRPFLNFGLPVSSLIWLSLMFFSLSLKLRFIYILQYI